MWPWMRGGWAAVRLVGITGAGGTPVPRCGCIARVGLISVAGTVMRGSKVAPCLIFCATTMGLMRVPCGGAFSQEKTSRKGVVSMGTLHMEMLERFRRRYQTLVASYEDVGMKRA